MKAKLVACLAAAFALIASAWSQSAEKPSSTRASLPLDGEWKVCADAIQDAPTDEALEKAFEASKGMAEKYYAKDFDDSKWGKAVAPCNFELKEGDNVRWVRKTFSLPDPFKGGAAYLKFRRAGVLASVWVNGQLVGTHEGMFAPFMFEVSKLLKPGAENVMAVRLYAWPPVSRTQNTPFTHLSGCEFYSKRYVGIGPVELIALPEAHIRTALVDAIPDGRINARLKLSNISKTDRILVAQCVLKDAAGKVVKTVECGTVELKQGDSSAQIQAGMGPVEEWCPERPVLYELSVALKDAATGDCVDVWRDDIGFRKFEARGREFFLNGRRVFPFGASDTSFLMSTRADAKPERIDIPTKRWEATLGRLKRAGINFVYEHPLPSPRGVFKAADRMGMLMIAANGFNPAWFKGFSPKQTFSDGYVKKAMRCYEEFIEENYNSPSIVIWSLSNESYNPANLAAHNAFYDFVKGVDPGRLILTNNGSSSEKDIVVAEAGMERDCMPGLKTDISDIHLYHGWYEQPLQFLGDDTLPYRNTTRPHIMTESVSFYCAGEKIGPNYVQLPMWLKNLGHKAAFDMEERFRKRWNSIQYHVEYQRIHKEAYAAAMVFCEPSWERELPVWKELFSPVTLCAVINDRNYFAPGEIKFTAYAINDLRAGDKKDLLAKIRLLDGSGRELASFERELKSLPAMTTAELPVSLKVPARQAKGFCTLAFTLSEKDGSSLHEGAYQVFIMPKEDVAAKIETVRKTLVVSQAKEGGIAPILDSLSIGFRKIAPREIKDASLEGVDLLIIDAGALDDSMVDCGGKLKGYVKDGGRILCLEQERPLFRGWLPTQFQWLECKDPANRRRSGQENAFADVRRPDHPLFRGLKWNNFDTWNGMKGVIANGLLLSSLPEGDASMLATGVANSGTQSGCLVYDVKHGKGEYLLSQLEAVRRWNSDPVATKYLVNMLDYMLNGTPDAPEAKVQEMESVGPGPYTCDADGFIRHWLICGPFPNPGGRPAHQPYESQQKGFDKDYLMSQVGGFFIGGEGEVVPVQGKSYAAVFPKTVEGYWGISRDAEVKCQWNGIASSKSYVDFEGRFQFHDGVAAYAACYVESPADMKVKMKAGSDDGHKLWVNYDLAGSLNTFRGAAPDQEQYDATLKKGMNLVMLKVTQDVGGFGFYLRIAKPEGGAVPGLKIWLAPNGAAK